MQPRDVLAPVGSALLLDLADLITFGPLGLWTGLGLGLVVGWMLAPQLGFANRRWLPSLLAGVYCMTPGTALLPLAAIWTAVRSLVSPQASPPPPAPGAGDRNALEADYEARWDDDHAPPRDCSGAVARLDSRARSQPRNYMKFKGF